MGRPAKGTKSPPTKAETGLVLDNSIVMAWSFEDESSRYADTVLDELEATRAVVPALWPLEVANALLVGERPPSANLIFGYSYCGVGNNSDGIGDNVLGVVEYNYGGYGGSCPEGPYKNGPGNPKTQCDAFHFYSQHIGGAHFLFADGSVRFLSYSAVSVMPALATRGGGEVVSDF